MWEKLNIETINPRRGVVLLTTLERARKAEKSRFMPVGAKISAKRLQLFTHDWFSHLASTIKRYNALSKSPQSKVQDNYIILHFYNTKHYYKKTFNIMNLRAITWYLMDYYIFFFNMYLYTRIE